MEAGREIIEKELSKPVEHVSVINLLDGIFDYAYRLRVSDIHIDPAEKDLKIRFRIDGILHHMFVISKELQDEIISRIKVLSGLRTDEHQVPQDGRFRFKIADAAKDKVSVNFDIRVSIEPTFYGENAILRLLVAPNEAEFSLESRGFSPRDLAAIKKAIQKPYGMILSTGPTGSGKTTTLYTVLKTLNTEGISIITIEDPIEFSLDGVDQIQVNHKTGLTFAEGLRSILRQDPNIIMVGEIRDEETANIAVNAALTGHLLLSTLHTNDAATALPRLTDMKVEPFLIASTINVVIGQRLVRKICLNCKKEKKFSVIELQSLAKIIPRDLLEKNILNKENFYYGEGCSQCENTGYKGRIGIFEVLEMTDATREGVMKRLDSAEIKKIAVHEGMTTLLEDGFNKAREGITTVEEVLRVTYE